MANTGTKVVLTLRKYVDGVATSETKINSPGDPDYIAPYQDLVDCPIGDNQTTAAPTAAPTTEAPSDCTCITVDVLNTQLQDGGLDLYYTYNDCSGQVASVNLFQSIGIEQNGSTYFGLCKSGVGSNMFKYGENGDLFVGLEGMNTTPNGTSCGVGQDCYPVLP